MLIRFVVAATTLALGVVIWGIYNFSSERGAVIDRWEVSNAKFKLRVTAYREKAIMTPGAFYVFQSGLKDADEWREILTVLTDEPIPIPRENIRFVDDQIAYFFMRNYYAVTPTAVAAGLSGMRKKVCLTGNTSYGPTPKTCISSQMGVGI